MTTTGITKEPTQLQQIQRNWVVRTVNRSIIAVTAASLLFIVFYWRGLPPSVPLWYSLPWGADQLASPYWLFLLPLGSALILTTNTLVSVYVLSEYLLFVQLSYLGSLVVSLLSFVTLVKILTIIS